MGVAIGTFVLVAGSSVFHALWNFFTRKLKGNLAVLYLGLCTGALMMFPVVLVVNLVPTGISTEITLKGLSYTFASGIIHTFYFVCLSLSYKYGEISVVYPIARGTGVGLTSLAAFTMLNETISSLGWVGIWCIVSGVILVGLKWDELCCKPKDSAENGDANIQLHAITTDDKVPLATSNEVDENDEEQADIIEEKSAIMEENMPSELLVEKVSPSVQEPGDTVAPSGLEKWVHSKRQQFIFSIVLSLLVGVSICAYSIVDKVGVSNIDPCTYIFMFFLTTCFGLLPYMLLTQRPAMKDAVKNFKKYILGMAPAVFGSYLAILFAFQQTNASYIVAMREMSVVIGSILGFVFLKEKLLWTKIVGICSIAIGLVFVKIA